MLAIQALQRLGLARDDVCDQRPEALAALYARILDYHQGQFTAADRDGSTDVLITALGEGQFAYGQRPGVNLWEDVALATLVGQGAEDATVVFRERFAERVGQWQRRYCPRDPFTVEDFLADLLLPRQRSGPRIESYRGHGPLESWLKQVFISLCHKRREAQLSQLPANTASGADEAESDPLQQVPADDDPPDERYARYECREKLAPLIAECLGRLDDRRRQVLMLSVIDGVPQKRVAQLFGVPEYKITRLKHSAVKRVADAFAALARRTARLTTAGVRRCLDLLLERFPLD